MRHAGTQDIETPRLEAALATVGQLATGLATTVPESAASPIYYQNNS